MLLMSIAVALSSPADAQSAAIAPAGVQPPGQGGGLQIAASGDVKGAKDAAAIEAAIAQACGAQSPGWIGTRGAKVSLAPGMFYINRTLVLNCSNVGLVGAGAGGPNDGNANNTNPLNGPAATAIEWVGSPHGTMVRVDSGTAAPVVGASVTGVSLIGSTDFGLSASTAAFGLVLNDTHFGTFDIATFEFGETADGRPGAGVSLNAVHNENWYNSVSVVFRQINQRGTGLQLTGNASYDVAYTRFARVFGQYAAGTGIDVQVADNDDFGDVSLQKVGTAASAPIRLRGGPTLAETARAITFDRLSLGVNGGTVSVEGLGQGRDGVTVRFPSHDNLIEVADYENVFNAPAIGPGATLAILNGPWQPYSPVVSCGSGALASATPSGAFQKHGKLVKFSVDIRIAANGTCKAPLGVTLPLELLPSRRFNVVGQDVASHKALLGDLGTSSSVMSLVRYDGAYPGVDGSDFVLNGEYTVQ